MRRLRGRWLSLAMALSLVSTLLVAPMALATDKGWSTLHDAGGHPWLFVGTWGGGNYFLGRYQVVKMQDAGQTWWSFTKFEISGEVEGGGNCIQCEGWSMSAKVQFLTAANVKVGGDYYPPIGQCYAHYVNPSWVELVKCSSGYQIPTSATKIKYTLTMFVATCCGISHWDTVTKTVPIV